MIDIGFAGFSAGMPVRGHRQDKGFVDRIVFLLAYLAFERFEDESVPPQNLFFLLCFVNLVHGLDF